MQQHKGLEWIIQTVRQRISALGTLAEEDDPLEAETYIACTEECEDILTELAALRDAVKARRDEYLANLPRSWTENTGRLTLETLRTEQAAELMWMLGEKGAAGDD